MQKPNLNKKVKKLYPYIIMNEELNFIIVLYKYYIQCYLFNNTTRIAIARNLHKFF